MGKIHLVMPMGGAGSRFKKQSISTPKPLIEINNKPFLYWSTISIFNYVDVEDLTFVVLKQHIDEFKIDNTILNYFPNAKIKIIDEVLPGPVHTCMKGVEGINDDKPIIFNDCDHMFKSIKLNEDFNNNMFNADGALLTFESNLPQFSYIKFENKKIVGTVEKKVVSPHAICGAYVFKNKEIFEKMANEYIKSCPYDECFMSGIYNVMCKHNLKIIDYLLDYHIEFGTPEEYEEAKRSKYFEKN